MQSLFTQNIIAVIWDFDKTLSPVYMQAPLFRKYDVDEKTFWNESNKLGDYYRERGIKNASDTLYLDHILTYVKSGRFKGLTNEILRELGSEVPLYEGLPDFLRAVKEIADEERFVKHGIQVEHYVASTGLRAMIEGSPIAAYLDDIWACEFTDSVPQPGYLATTDNESNDGVICGIAYSIDNTTKTRALFEINKGSNKHKEIEVNATLAPEDRRVPFQNMIYIADGPSDVPAFSIVNQYGGRTIAVYKPTSIEHFQAVDKLQKENRVQGIAEANYVPGSLAALWITCAVREIAERVVRNRETLLKERTGSAPRHILSDIGQTPKKKGAAPGSNHKETPPAKPAPAKAYPPEQTILIPSGAESKNKFLVICRSYLKTSNGTGDTSVLEQWFDQRIADQEAPAVDAFITELETSIQGTPVGNERPAKGPKNESDPKLMSFLEDLERKHFG